MLAVCVLTQTAALLTCVGRTCVRVAGWKRRGLHPSVLSCQASEQQAECVAMLVCVCV